MSYTVDNKKNKYIMEPNSDINNPKIEQLTEVIQQTNTIDNSEDEGLLSKRNIILALLLLLFILFFSILAYSAKYYFDNQSKRPATIQSLPITNSSNQGSTSSSLPSSSTSNESNSASSTTSSSKAPEPKAGSINSDTGLLVRNDDGSIKYPNAAGARQGAFDDKDQVKIDTTKGKKEFTIGTEKLTFVYGIGTTKEGWIAEKYIVYR